MAKSKREKIPVVAIHYLDDKIMHTEITRRFLKYKNNKEFVYYGGRDREVKRKHGVATVDFRSVTIRVPNSSYKENCYWCGQIVENP